jgi:hypothetical protein
MFESITNAKGKIRSLPKDQPRTGERRGNGEQEREGRETKQGVKTTGGGNRCGGAVEVRTGMYCTQGMGAREKGAEQKSRCKGEGEGMHAGWWYKDD